MDATRHTNAHCLWDLFSTSVHMAQLSCQCRSSAASELQKLHSFILMQDSHQISDEGAAADASAAVTHAMGLLVAHALHAVHLRASHRSLVLRSGPLVAGPRVSITWALLQVGCRQPETSLGQCVSWRVQPG